MTLGHCTLPRPATATFFHPTIAAEVLLHILRSAAVRTTLTVRSQEFLEAATAIIIGRDGVFRFRDALGEIAGDQPANFNRAEEHESDLWKSDYISLLGASPHL